MYRLSLLILLFFISIQVNAQSPHGRELKTDCAQCHTSESWLINMETIQFNHNVITEFQLEGSHAVIDCKECHTSLVFNEVENQCISCHTDVHSATVGNDCIRCHTSSNWIVNTIPELHVENGFPLIGVHNSLDCTECHSSETDLRFETMGNDCINCHQDDFENSINPNHKIAEFSTDCTECHSSLDSSWSPGNFSHDVFPLTLGHDIQECKQCHANNEFTNTSPECLSCHQNEFNNSQKPNHISANFSTDCTSCHTTNPNWTPANWNHDEVYPLNGAHIAIEDDCIACHKEEYTTYNNTPNTCVGCHQDDYDTVFEPNHKNSNYPEDCLQCHTESSWTPADWNHDMFPLTLSHDIQDCAQCHTTNNYADTSSECASCHQNDYNATNDPNHLNAGFSTDCTTCHTTGDWTPADWNHDMFPLTLSHDINDCAQCHTTNNYADTSSECASCHQNDYNTTNDPNHLNAGFSTDCTACHTTGDWTPADWNHDMFPLTLSHDINDCAQCHTTNNYADTSSECVSCHQNDYNTTNDPNHQNSGFSTDCTTCHTTGDWSPADWNHDMFSLTLSHDIQDCTQCHTTNNYADTSSECISCHQNDYNTTNDPNHLNAGFSTDCTACHTTGDWTPSTFNHDMFPLTLSHDIQDCTQCHTTNNYADTSSECASCHQNDYNTTNDPNHLNAGFSTDCTACHTTGDWTPSTFNHDMFPLTLSHDIQDCTQCHTTNNYADTSSECASCHQNDYNTTNDPNHLNAGFSTDCTACHTTGDWVPADWNHDMFSLTESHDIQDCMQCHTTNNYTDTSSECASCHQNDYNTTNDPNHLNAGFSTDCTACHTTGDWSPANWNHDMFPLTESHDIQDCMQCHTTNNYTDTSSECASCHQNDYNTTNDPNHLNAGFSTDCTACHTTGDWSPANWNHDMFPLTESHDIQDCTQCHTTNNYADTSPECISCHQSDYNVTNDPNHLNAGFSTDCTACHTTGDWSPSTFNHDMFPLTLSHDIQDCTQCHTTNNYADTSPECISCHQSDYNATNDPSHLNAQFATDCTICHTTEGWTPSTFDHDSQYFPIYSGKHQGEWNQCTDCHTIPNNYTSFSCIDCHEHSNKADVDDDHREERDYVYQSSACYDCHPTGSD